MRFRLTFLTGFSLFFMGLGLFLSFVGRDGAVSGRYFFITLGILGWFTGNRLVELDERVRELEQAAGDRQTRGADAGHGSDAGPAETPRPPAPPVPN